MINSLYLKTISGAVLHIQGIKHPIRTTKNGEYWKLLLPGTYSMRVKNPQDGKFTRIHEVTVPKSSGRRASALRYDFQV